MLLLTGATGLVGSAVLRRLTAAGQPVRCLVRDPRRLGSERVRVQIALGDLGDPRGFRNALRDVTTVVHLGATTRDQRAGSLEELNGIASWRLARAAAAAGVEHFVLFSALEASLEHPVRFFRTKGFAEHAVAESGLAHTVFAPSVIYALEDPWLTLLHRLSVLPVMPTPGHGRAVYQPVWAEDVADCVVAALGAGAPAGGAARHELAGPETLSYEAMVSLALRSFGRGQRRLWPISPRIVRRGLRLLEGVVGPGIFATWDEVELLKVSLLAASGTTDMERLGVRPHAMAAVLGA